MYAALRYNSPQFHRIHNFFLNSVCVCVCVYVCLCVRALAFVRVCVRVDARACLKRRSWKFCSVLGTSEAANGLGTQMTLLSENDWEVVCVCVCLREREREREQLRERESKREADRTKSERNREEGGKRVRRSRK